MKKEGKLWERQTKIHRKGLGQQAKKKEKDKKKQQQGGMESQRDWEMAGKHPDMQADCPSLVCGNVVKTQL